MHGLLNTESICLSSISLKRQRWDKGDSRTCVLSEFAILEGSWTTRIHETTYTIKPEGSHVGLKDEIQLCDQFRKRYINIFRKNIQYTRSSIQLVSWSYGTRRSVKLLTKIIVIIIMTKNNLTWFALAKINKLIVPL